MTEVVKSGLATFLTMERLALGTRRDQLNRTEAAWGPALNPMGLSRRTSDLCGPSSFSGPRSAPGTKQGLPYLLSKSRNFQPCMHGLLPTHYCSSARMMSLSPSLVRGVSSGSPCLLSEADTWWIWGQKSLWP